MLNSRSGTQQNAGAEKSEWHKFLKNLTMLMNVEPRSDKSSHSVEAASLCGEQKITATF